MTKAKEKGLIELFQLVDYMALKSEPRRIPKGKITHKTKDEKPPRGAIIQRDYKYYRVTGSGPEDLEPVPDDFNVIYSPVMIDHARHFQLIFDRHWFKYQKEMPGASVDQYKRHSIKWLTQKIETVKKEAPGAWDSDPIRWAEVYIDDYLKAEAKETGMNCVLTPDVLRLLYKEMKGKYIEGREIDFVAAFIPEPLPPGFKRIKWVDVAPSGPNAGKSNQATLRAFLSVMKDDKTIRVDDVKLFIDKWGKGFKKISNRQNDASEKRNMQRFKKIIDGL